MLTRVHPSSSFGFIYAAESLDISFVVTVTTTTSSLHLLLSLARRTFPSGRQYRHHRRYHRRPIPNSSLSSSPPSLSIRSPPLRLSPLPLDPRRLVPVPIVRSPPSSVSSPRLYPSSPPPLPAALICAVDTNFHTFGASILSTVLIGRSLRSTLTLTLPPRWRRRRPRPRPRPRRSALLAGSDALSYDIRDHRTDSSETGTEEEGAPSRRGRFARL